MKIQPVMPPIIYHLLTESDFQTLCQEDWYIPALFEQDGFIHCTAGRDTLLAVANDYFLQVVEPVLVLVIDLPRVTTEVKFEPPLPIPGSGVSHLQEEQLFPHIYGPLNLDAVTGVGRLRQSNGQFAWPDAFVSLAAYKSNPAKT